MWDTCGTHVGHMWDSLFFWIAFGISFLIQWVTAIYQNGVEVQKLDFFNMFLEKVHNSALVARIELKKKPMAMI